MPTFNSEKTIDKALRSIREQNIDQSEIEILVIDGGSTDATIDIAKQYNAIILFNEKRLPEYAKSIGMLNAKGRYVIKQDSDEVYLYPEQIKKRIELLATNPKVKCILPDKLIAPNNYSFACAYLNMFGDPFTYFIYKNKGSTTDNYVKNINNYKNGEFIFKFAEQDILPIGDAGTTTIDFEFVRENFPEKIHELSFASTVFNDIVKKSGYVGCIKNDNILHYSEASLGSYFSKLRFRVISNIFNRNGSGFSSRSVSNVRVNKRKYLYPLYCATIVFPLYDSIKFTIKYRDLSYLMHFIYSYYVLFEILIQYLFKLLGLKSVNSAYGSVK